MKKSKIFNIGFAAMAVAGTMFATSCDEVSEDDRQIEMGEVIPQRTILLVDFTGQRCMNCPAAHEIIETLEEQFGDSLVAVSMHAFGMGIPVSNPPKNQIGLASQEGDEYDKEYNTLGSWPAGVIDLEGNALNASDWSGAVRTPFTYPATAVIKVDSEVKGDSVISYAHISSKEALKGTVTLWLIEDSITAVQLVGSTADREYVHNHVFRRVLTPLNGYEVTLQPDDPQTLRFAIELVDTDNEHFDRKNLSMVGFIRNGNKMAEVTCSKVVFNE